MTNSISFDELKTELEKLHAADPEKYQAFVQELTSTAKDLVESLKNTTT